jgi:exopolyphosphatase/guanosine-5'-triphosphate,3'-diphosphate pyrophosphatase
VRLLFANVLEEANGHIQIKKESLVRNAIRLGDDAFLKKHISEEKVERLVHLMHAYKHLIAAEQPITFRACATSSMRDADNGAQIVERVLRETGISIEIISGKEEAEMVYANESEQKMAGRSSSFLYMDIGGGSVELTLLENGEVQRSRSFNLGTIRQLNGIASKEEFQEMEKWVKQCRKNRQKIEIIGSGGNINKLYKMVRNKSDNTISRRMLSRALKAISGLSYEERISRMSLNPDRADVIVPALETFQKVMKWSKAEIIVVPTIGVSDGIIHQLYNKYKEQN